MTTLSAMADLEKTVKKIEHLEAQLAEARIERDAMIAKALENGGTVRAVADLAGVSKSRVDVIGRRVNK